MNKNEVLIQAVKNICENCKECKVLAKKVESDEIMIIRAKYCKDGSGYIDIDLYDSTDKYVDSCKLKHPTDSCILPYNLEVFEEPDCNCIPSKEGRLL